MSISYGEVLRPDKSWVCACSRSGSINATTCLRGKPLVNAMRTASARNSGVGFDAMMSLLCGKIPSQRSGTIPRQVHFAQGTAVIQHGETSEQFKIDHDELDWVWEPVGGSERGMGPETIYQAVVNHDELGDLRWTVSEYPAGAGGIKQTKVGRHKLIKDFDYGLEPEFDDDDC